MAGFDPNAEFEKMSETAKAASEKLELAVDETRDRLAADVAIAQDKASEAADRLKNKTETAHDRASEHWQEAREQWHGDVARAREHVTKGTAEIDPKHAAMDADTAQSYAADPIDFADPSVDEAECGVQDALSARPEPPAP